MESLSRCRVTGINNEHTRMSDNRLKHQEIVMSLWDIPGGYSELLDQNSNCRWRRATILSAFFLSSQFARFCTARASVAQPTLSKCPYGRPAPVLSGSVVLANLRRYPFAASVLLPAGINEIRQRPGHRGAAHRRLQTAVSCVVVVVVLVVGGGEPLVFYYDASTPVLRLRLHTYRSPESRSCGRSF